MENVMIDLETMGTHPEAAIIAIGAVEFDVNEYKLGEGFYYVIDLESSVEAGGVMDPKTVIWWMQQEEAARAEFFNLAGVSIRLVLQLLESWLCKRCNTSQLKIWGNGADFDNVLLTSAFRNCGMHPPWRFYNNRCFRTMRDTYSKLTVAPSVAPEFEGTRHNALDDAKHQAQQLLEIFRYIHGCEYRP